MSRYYVGEQAITVTLNNDTADLRRKGRKSDHRKAEGGKEPERQRGEELELILYMYSNDENVQGNFLTILSESDFDSIKI